MVHRLNVVQKYISGTTLKVAAKKTLDEEDMSKEDPSVQTSAVERLINKTIRTKLPHWKNKVFAVGGFVRDSLLGKSADDLDLVADDPDHAMESGKELAEQLARELGITTPNNPQVLDEQFKIYGLVLANPKVDGKRVPFTTEDGVDISGYKLEITPPRKEGSYDSKRRPTSVEYTSRKEDSLRRDLTVNSLLKNITGPNLDNSEENIEDYSGGLKDLKDKVLRKPEHPDRGPLDIYFDDPLRILRLVRFKGKMGDFKIDPDTEKDAKKFMESTEGREIFKDKVSPERVKEELVKVLTLPNGRDAREGLERMNEYNVLDFISPTLAKLLDVRHDSIHHKGESAWEHTMEVLEKTPPRLETRLAALFHDIGKPDTFSVEEEYFDDSKGVWVLPSDKSKSPDGSKRRPRNTFKNHADVGSGIVDTVMKDLKFSSNIINSVKNMVHGHMGLKHAKPGSGSFMYRGRVLITKLYDNIDDIVDLMRADMNDAHKSQEENKRFEKMFDELKKLKEKDTREGLVIPSGKGGHEYQSPISMEDLKDFDQNLINGRAFGAIKEHAKIRSMSGTFTNKSEHLKEMEDLLRNEKALNKFIGLYDSYRKGKGFYKRFDRQ
jgi:putative nucleotidyltransferase with HDIG domain